MNGLVSFYSPVFFRSIVYMLQSTEYQVGPYLAWFWRTNDFAQVMRRRSLDKTKAARLLLLALKTGALLQILIGLIWLYFGLKHKATGGVFFGLAVIISYPIVWAHLIVLPLIAGRLFIIKPKQRRLIAKSKQIFANHRGTKIAVAGSFGKTSMKELLAVVLAEGKKVAVTPANKNVASSHAIFAASLSGDEDILVIEYGEGRPGDVRQFAETTQPNIGIITGIAPAHLDHYPTLEAAAEDIFSLAHFLRDENVYINGQSPAATNYIKDEHHVYSETGLDNWRVKNVKVTEEKTSFTLENGKQKLKLTSGLLGRHQIGPLSAAAVLGLEVGLSAAQVEAGVAKTKAFEHRMQPRHLNGAWIIDDTYNGNIDGIRAGLALLKELPAKRKIYVTPGLVDQGVETKNVHVELGTLIADAKPDQVVLMDNSVTAYIKQGIEQGGYSGDVRIEDDPLNFYLNIEHFVASGDLVLMQNDWTDNYA